jgi:cytochrome c
MAAGAAALCVQSVAYAAAGEDEAKEHGCVKCHEMDKKKVGPSWKDVSAKYKGKKADEVMTSVKGKPVHKQTLTKTADSSLKTIVDWVLEQK